ncbi:MAG: hypothetical protein WCN98_02330 [Verrucomicrobiaceae bacterium]
MKSFPYTPSILALCFLTLLPATLRAEDKPSLNSDKTKDILEKLVGEAKKAAGKLQEGGDKGNALWPHSKETLALPKADYLKRAESGLKTMAAEIQALGEAETAVNSRAYFKTRLESLKQNLDYCRQDLDKLTAVESEETFRVKQKKLDRTLGFLGDNIVTAKEEAGL